MLSRKNKGLGRYERYSASEYYGLGGNEGFGREAPSASPVSAASATMSQAVSIARGGESLTVQAAPPAREPSGGGIFIAPPAASTPSIAPAADTTGGMSTAPALTSPVPTMSPTVSPTAQSYQPYQPYQPYQTYPYGYPGYPGGYTPGVIVTGGTPAKPGAPKISPLTVPGSIYIGTKQQEDRFKIDVTTQQARLGILAGLAAAYMLFF